VDGLRFPPVVLRPGGVSVEDIRSCGGVWESCESIPRAENGEVDDHAPRAPGMKYQHYSPRAQVVLHEHGAHLPTGKELVQSVRRKGKIGVLRTRTWPEGFAKKAVEEEVEKDREKRLAKKRAKTNGTVEEDNVESAEVEVIEWSLGEKGSDISRALFKGLRDLDQLEVGVIYVEGIAEETEGLAIMNRLYKAASIVVRKVVWLPEGNW
jgi:L-threonylcarbamoyladenylate synthase